MNAPLTSTAAVTVFTSDNAPLTKRFSVTPEGELHKATLAVLTDGCATPTAAPTVKALAQILDNLTPHQALSTGQPKGGGAAQITTQARQKPGAVTRSLENFHYPKGPGWLLWDYDDKTMTPEVADRVKALGGPVEAFFHIWPEARQGSYLIRPSSSDGVAAPGIDPMHSAGLHGFFLVADVAQSRVILDTLEKRAWAAGLAWIALSASGHKLTRSIVDTAVGSPERLIFEAQPILVEPVTRNPRPSIMHQGLSPLPSPTLPADLLTRAEGAEVKAQRAIAPEAASKARTYDDSRAGDMAKRSGISHDAALRLVRQMRQGATLDDDHLLQMPDGAWLRVGDILDRPGDYHRKAIPDPIEGIAYGKDKATLFLTPRPSHPSEKPRLVSHAHGARTIYRFARHETTPPQPPETVEPVHPMPDPDRSKQIAATGEAIETWGARSFEQITAQQAVKQRFADIPEDLPKDARRAMQRAARRAVQHNMGLAFKPTSKGPQKGAETLRELVSGAQGVGKTAAIVGAVRDGQTLQGVMHQGAGIVTALFSTDHAKSDEARRDYEASAPPGAPIPVSLLGRTAPHPFLEGETACRIGAQAQRAAERGVNVRDALCPQCPHRNGCAWLERIQEVEQAAKAPEGAAIFAPHDYAFLTLPGGVKLDRAIFDERVRDLGLRTHAIPVDQWSDDLRPFVNFQAQSAANTADDLSDLLRLINPLRTAVGRAVIERSETPLADIAAEAAKCAKEGETPAQVLERAADALEGFTADTVAAQLALAMGDTTPQGRGRPTKLETRLDNILDAAGEKHVRAVVNILRAVAKELEQGHGPALRAVSVEKANGKASVVAHEIAAATFPTSIPLLHLDGTADPDLAAAWFGPLTHHHFPVDRLTLGDAVFVGGHSFSQVSITGVNPKTGDPVYPDKAEAMRADLRTLIAKYPGAFVATTKAALAALGELPDHTAAYFGALRGRNMAEGCETGLVIGRILPPIRSMEKTARAFAVALDRPFEPLPPPAPGSAFDGFPERLEGIRMRDGTGHPVKVAYHPDPTAQAVLRQTRDAETVQAIDRVRAMFASKRLIVLGASIPDMTFDRVDDWQDVRKGGTRLQKAIARKVVPLSPTELRRVYPDLWGSLNTAKNCKEHQPLRGKIGENELQGNTVLKDILIPYCPLIPTACLVRYQMPKKSGRGRPPPLHLAFVIGKASEARAALEAVTGPVDSFQIVNWTAEAARIDAAEQQAAMVEADQLDHVAQIIPLPRPVLPEPKGLPARSSGIVSCTGPPGAT